MILHSENRVAPGIAFNISGEALVRLGPLVALMLICVAFGVFAPRFASVANLSLVIQQISVLGVIAIGQTLIILTGGIDLSCGAIMALGGVVMTRLAVLGGVDPYLAMLIGVTTCVALGAVNGFLVSYVKLPPFIVTLGMLNVASAASQLYSGGNTVTGLPQAMLAIGDRVAPTVLTITYASVTMLVLFVLFWHLLTNTTWGSRIYTIGDNSEAARLMGVSVGWFLFSAYVVAGSLYGIAALMSVARTAAGDPYAGQLANLDSITAVVLGGTSLFGGRGSIWGTFVGIFLIGVLANGLILMGVDSTYQILITGALVIVAVLVDTLARRSV